MNRILGKHKLNNSEELLMISAFYGELKYCFGCLFTDLPFTSNKNACASFKLAHPLFFNQSSQ